MVNASVAGDSAITLVNAQEEEKAKFFPRTNNNNNGAMLPPTLSLHGDARKRKLKARQLCLSLSLG